MVPKVANIAILGATGQIGKGLIDALSPRHTTKPFGRNISDFHLLDHDVIVNAAGPGQIAQHAALGAEMHHITERLDRIGLDYLERHPATLYCFLSTGAVYRAPNQDDHYAAAKRTAEARHRALPHRIYDIRIFGYFSRYIPLDGSFFL